MRKQFIAFALAAIVGTLPTLGSAQIAADTKGGNLTHFKAGDYSGAQLPTAYSQPKVWKMSKTGGADLNLEEAGRDEWSVYLKLPNQKEVAYTIDVFKKEFKYSRLLELPLLKPVIGQPLKLPVRQLVAEVVPVTAADAVVNGANAGGADFFGGGLRLVGAGQWVDGQGRNFRETGRDAWSVMLAENGTNAGAQIDLWKKLVTLPGAKPVAIAAATVSATNMTIKGGVGVKGATLSKDQIKNIMIWMTAERVIASTPFCYRESKKREDAIARNNCGPGKRFINGGCYDNCPPGHSDNGTPTCLQTSCPSGYIDLGLVCQLKIPGDAQYSPVHWDKCAYRGAFNECYEGPKEDGCKHGYHKEASMCYLDVPEGMGGTAATPTKGSNTPKRTEPGCNSNRVDEGGLCYLPRDSNSTCTQVACSPNCASGTQECGPAACAKDQASCGRGITDMVVGPLQVIAFASTGGAAGMLNTAAKAMLAAADANDLVAAASIMQDAIENAMAMAESDFSSISSDYIAGQLSAKYTKGSANYKRLVREWVSVVLAINASQSGVDMGLLGASMADQTGVISTIVAYVKPPCFQHSPIP